MRCVPKAKEKIRDRERYEWLQQWMLDNKVREYKGETYWELRTWLLRSGIVQHVKLSKSESDPFVMGTDFYGVTFEATLDAARLVGKKKDDLKAPLPSSIKTGRR
jgi:hypothetical protein